MTDIGYLSTKAGDALPDLSVISGFFVRCSYFQLRFSSYRTRRRVESKNRHSQFIYNSKLIDFRILYCKNSALCSDRFTESSCIWFQTCAKYWPESGSQIYGPFEVELVSAETFREYSARTLKFANREQGVSWPTVFHFNPFRQYIYYMWAYIHAMFTSRNHCSCR